MWRPTQSAAQRGYGYAHQKRRKALLPFAIGMPCPMCGIVMLASDHLDLDHSTPLALGGSIGDRMVHRKCNQLAGAKLGSAMSRSRKAGWRDW